jgi:toxin FitB
LIVLDTNVVSEAMKPEPHQAVRTWLNDQAAETLYLSSVTLAELLFGIAALPVGKRKDMLAQALDGLMGLFRDRVLPFDTDAARRYAELAVMAKTSGRGFPTPDGYIAATWPPSKRPASLPSIRGIHSGAHLTLNPLTLCI